MRKVYLVIRGDDLYKDMSSYLEVLNTEFKRMFGDTQLSGVELAKNKTGEVRRLKTPALLSFIGAVPRTDWLPQEIPPRAMSGPARSSA